MDLENDVHIEGPGVQPEGVRALRDTYFTVDVARIAEKLRPAPAARPRAVVLCLGNDQNPTPRSLNSECKQENRVSYTFTYRPTTFGEHTVMVLYDGRPTRQEVFHVCFVRVLQLTIGSPEAVIFRVYCSVQYLYE